MNRCRGNHGTSIYRLAPGNPVRHNTFMILQSFLLLLPILILVLGGWLLSRFHELSGDTLVKAITEVLMPMLIFNALATSDIEFSLVADLAGVTTFVVAVLAFP